VWRQLIQATPWGNKPRHLLHDHDAVYGRDFRQQARRIGIDAIATPVASPRANAIIERFMGTLRRECLDHLIVLDEQHLRSVLAEFVRYYNLERPHRTLWLATPVPVDRPTEGSVRSRPVLGGLHHVYERVARPTDKTSAPPQAGRPQPGSSQAISTARSTAGLDNGAAPCYCTQLAV
jgi:hypothetical protein